MSKRARNLRRLISYHEAGHAVVARKLDVEIPDIDMNENDDYVARVLTRRASSAAEQAGGNQAALAHGFYIDVMVALAGAAAQKLAGYPTDHIDAHDDDMKNAGNYAGMLARLEASLPKIGPNEPPHMLKPGDPLHTAICAIIERAWAETATMLQSNW